ncbi:hypothetical protein GGR92_004984 [Spirosoma lacussanchae]|uniref:conjugal transfer protein n=1 Tax=Spirosoma lacussanchae TaxID=1884249 RepID=UPI0011083BB2|nr:conjugal transfer protein [Spirosoma lacussanchae]
MLFDAYKTLLGLYADMTASTMDITALIESKIRAVAGIGALVYIFSRLIPQVMRSESIDFFPYLRPFMLMVLIGLSPRICNGIDKLGESIRTAVERQNGTLYEKIAEQTKLLQQTVDAKWQEIGEHPELFRQVDPTFNPDAFGAGLKLQFAEYSEKFKYELLSYTQDILLALMQLAECILFLISFTYRLVLRMGAPIAIALAVFPGMSNNIAEWFGKYINYTLLPTVAALYSSIAFKVTLKYLSYYDPKTIVLGNAGGAEAHTPEYMGLAFIGILVMCLIGYCQVPSMTNMLVTVGGVGAMVQGATSLARSGAGTVAAPVSKPLKAAGHTVAARMGNSVANSVTSVARLGGNMAAGVARSPFTMAAHVAGGAARGARAGAASGGSMLGRGIKGVAGGVAGAVVGTGAGAVAAAHGATVGAYRKTYPPKKNQL